jgi:hypothetical protein
MEANSLWYEVCHNDVAMSELKSEITRLTYIRINEMKSILSSMLSLLASSDAIPNNYIPIIQIERLDSSIEVVASRHDECQILQQRILNYQLKNVALYHQLNNIETRFPDFTDYDGSIRIHVSAFQDLLSSYRPFLDLQNHCMKLETDTSRFWDFLNHPMCPASCSIHSFLTERRPGGFGKLVEDLISLYELTNDVDVLVALCSSSLIVEHSPTLIDFGTGVSQFVEAAFEFYIDVDPLHWLARMNEVCKNGDDTAILGDILSGLSVLASSWKEIVRYVVDFTVDDYLPPDLRAVRALLSAVDVK